MTIPNQQKDVVEDLGGGRWAAAMAPSQVLSYSERVNWRKHSEEDSLRMKNNKLPPLETNFVT